MALKRLYLILILNLFFYCTSFGQYRLLFRNESFTPERNSSTSRIAELNRKMASFHRKSFVIIQFDGIPTESETKQLKANGIELLDYIPNNAYTATVSGGLSVSSLQEAKVRSVVELAAKQKMHHSLANGTFPAHAVKVAGTVDLWISFPKTFSLQEVEEELRNKNFTITSDLFKNYSVLELRVPTGRVGELASLPFIQYVQAIPKEDQTINDHSTVNARANVLGSSFSGNRNLHGEGVVIGIGDNSDPLQHVDFSNRIINRQGTEVSASHGMHVMGTLGGSGIINENYKGYAPKATILAHYFSNILAYLPTYVKDNGMVVTNNSYGNDVTSCESFGTYDLYSQILDQQAFEMPYLQNVFAAGNSGANACSPFPTGFGNILGGYQSAKNIISVGNTTLEGEISGSSSRGPAKDGRIKPEIVAQGTNIISTLPGNLYGVSSGTSMSTPAVTGSIALLYQQYRKLNNGANPKSALMKALICNGGMDKGNAGPDFRYGFGWLNLLRSVKMLESKSYVNDSLTHNTSKTHVITIPDNTAQLKVMLYWNDPAAAILSSRTLVNDLDLEVTNSSSVKTLPKLLDAAPLHVNDPAATGADHINNIEQVVIDKPQSGNYTITVKGTAINQNPRQEYFIVYDAVPIETAIAYPIGGEHVKEGDVMYINWDSYGNDSESFSVQYSVDNGVSWSAINTAVAANLRQLSWPVPAVTTSQAKIRISKGNQVSSSGAFTIVGVPTATLDPVQCEGYIGMSWNAIPGITDYEVMMLQGNEMVSVATTTATNYTFIGLLKDQMYWVAVRARLNGNPGRRSVALSRKPDSGSCTGTMSDNDLKIDAIVSPFSSGRKFTSTELSANTSITVRIKNLDDVSSTGAFKINYYLDNNLVREQTIAPVIAAGGTYDHTFDVTTNLSAVKSYELKVTVNKTGDAVDVNNVLTKTLTQLPNNTVLLPFMDNMESLPPQEYLGSKMGLTSADRYDFSGSSASGRIRTFVNSGTAYSGNRALTLDTDRYISDGNINYLSATFNLSAFDVASDDIRMNFRYKNHGQTSNANNKVWIRGADTDDWIEVYNLYTNQNNVTEAYKLSSDIEIAHILAANGKSFSSSFQVRWGQYGKLLVSDVYNGSGYSFDDIQLFQVSNDAQLVSLNNPVGGCGLGSTEPVRITVRNNSANNLSLIPVKFQVDNGVVISETIPALDGKTNMDYTFQATADMSAFGPHKVKVWTDLASDSNPANDVITTDMYNAPVISSFPYLEDFETGSGFWYTGGTNISLKYGTPASSKINRAASGIKAWKTNLTGNYNVSETSYLYSPCLDVRGMLVPTLSFNLALDFEDCGRAICDVAYMEYSTDGTTWRRLGANNIGTNWYNKNLTNNNLWSVQDYTRWHVATIALPAGSENLRLRFVIKTDGDFNREGIAVDDIHIYDNRSSIYDGAGMSAAAASSAGEKGWINYTTNGSLIASVNSNNQDLGTTDVRVYIHPGSTRSTNGQYYHNRNITIKPVNYTLIDSVSVRFYFLDTETEKLISAAGCSGCGKPASAMELGISKYSDTNSSNEDGSTLNNNANGWIFITNSKVRKVPFDKGYYAEFKVKNLSEFWLSKESLNAVTPLPVTLLSFTAKKKEGTETSPDVIAEWVTTSEVNFSHFEIEVAKGNNAFKLGQFIKLGEILADGTEKSGWQYSFTDYENDKSDIRYYRLKMIDLDQTFQYSRAVSVIMDTQTAFQVYPNPSKDIFNIVYQANAGEEVQVHVMDLTGRYTLKNNLPANGSVQKYQVDLGLSQFAPGLYLIEIVVGKRKEVFRVVKL